MTFRQIQIAIENINIRKHNQFALKAKLSGHKMELIDREEQQIMKSVHNTTPEKDADISMQHEQYMNSLKE